MGDASSSFADDIRRIAGELRDAGPTHTAVNRASSAIDYLGRRLHGIGYLRGREIAECFTVALAELETCHGVPEEERAGAVGRAADRLQAALDYTEAGAPSDPHA
jgi:hypothetical protein